MKVAVVSEYARPLRGGIAEHVHFLSRGLAALGHEVILVSGGAPGGTDETGALDERTAIASGYRTIRIGRQLAVRTNGSSGRLTVGRGLQAQVARAVAGADVVHVHGSPGPALSLMALRASCAPVTVATFHTYFERGHWGYRLFRRYIGAAVERADRRIAVSRTCAERIAATFPGRYEVVPNGVDCALFHPGDARRPGPASILFVGRLDPRNGLDDLLAATGILSAEGRDLVVDVVGGGSAVERYRRMAARLGVAPRVRWHGGMGEERAHLFREATVLAAPCIRASFGMILVEALASGTPVVAADNAGFREVLDGAPGILVPPGDARALATGIARVLDDGRLRDEWGRRGREVAERRYDWQGIVRRVAAIYEEVAGRSTRSPRHGSWAAYSPSLRAGSNASGG